MQSLKPRCEGCGTSNALDAVFCQECGVGLNIENESVPITDIEVPVEYHELRGSLQRKNRNSDGKFIIKDNDDNSNVLFELDTNKRKLCSHMTTIQNVQCECVRCISCDTRTETCHEHIPHFDYGIQTKKKNSLDHLRDINGKFIVKDERLDFRSNQLADWYFNDAVVPCEYKDCIDIKPYHTYHYGASDNNRVDSNSFKQDKNEPRSTVPWDNRGWRTITKAKPPQKIEPIRDHIISKQDMSIPNEPFEEITIRKGLDGRKESGFTDSIGFMGSFLILFVILLYTFL